MRKDDFSQPEMFDAHIEELTRALEQRQRTHQSLKNAPDLRLTSDIRRAYQAEMGADSRSLERVLSRLLENDVPGRSRVIFLPDRNKEQEGISSMNDTTMNAVPQKKTPGKWPRRAGLLVAVFCLLLLVGGFLTVFNAMHSAKPAGTNVASAQNTPSPTPHGPIGTIVKDDVTSTEPLSWSPTGDRVAGIGADGVTPETWDVLTGTNIITYKMPFSNPSIGLMGALWSADGTRVAFAYYNGIAVFNARTAALLESLPLPSVPATVQNVQVQQFQALSWSPNERYLVTLYILVAGNTHTYQLYVWDLVTNQIVAKPASQTITNLTWSSDGKYLASWQNNDSTASNAKLDLWNTTTWQIAKTYTGVNDFSWSPDGSQMAVARNNGVQIVDTTSGNVERTFAGASGSVISGVDWQPHGTSVLVDISNNSQHTSYLSLWNTQTGVRIYTFTKYQGAFNSGQTWSSDGKYVLMSVFINPSNLPKGFRGNGAWHEVIWIAG